eukprot:536417_1
MKYIILIILLSALHLVILSMLTFLGIHGCLGFRWISRNLKQQKESPTTSNIFKYLYIICLITALLHIITAAAHGILWFCDVNVFGNQTNRTFIRIYGTMYGIHFETLLATLIARLHFTFQESAFKVSNANLFCIIMLYVFQCIIILLASIFARELGDLWTASILFHAGSALYLFLTIYTTTLFVKGLVQITTLTFQKKQSKQHKTKYDKITSVSNQTKENKFAQLEHRAARYIALISCAMFSTFMRCLIMAIMSAIVASDHDQFNFPKNRVLRVTFSLILAIDYLINVLCLHLQYKFSNKYYGKYCKCMHNLWERQVNSQITSTTNEIEKTAPKSGNAGPLCLRGNTTAKIETVDSASPTISDNQIP